MTSTAEPSSSSTKSRRRTIETESGRQVGYVFIEPDDDPDSEMHHRATAILYFYPLGCTSQILEELFPKDLKHSYRCSFVCVDRPEHRDTSALLKMKEEEESKDASEKDEFLHRIGGHVDDVLQVLQHESITTIYVLGACLGHPFAVELCRRVMNNTTSGKLKLQGLTLLAPFISPACPVSWKVARLGASVPNFLLRAGVCVFTAVDHAMPYLVLGLMDLKKRCYGTSDEKADKLVRILKIVQEMTNSSTASSRALEARLGVAESWQAQVCDKFAVESGCGLVSNEDESNWDKPSECTFPLTIHVSPEDKLVPYEAAKWISKRCYGGSTHLITHEDLKSHEEMIFFGGGLDNPFLLRTIASDWSLLSLADEGESK